MRRPTKELYDAVTGEGKYARRSSQIEPLAPETVKVKRESDVGECWKKLPSANDSFPEHAADGIPASPLAGKGSSGEEQFHSGVTERRRGQSSALAHGLETSHEESKQRNGRTETDAAAAEEADASEADPYEFTSSSPQLEKQMAAEEKKKKTGRKPSRRFSTAVDADEDILPKERAASRRRSMML